MLVTLRSFVCDKKLVCWWVVKIIKANCPWKATNAQPVLSKLWTNLRCLWLVLNDVIKFALCALLLGYVHGFRAKVVAVFVGQRWLLQLSFHRFCLDDKGEEVASFEKGPSLPLWDNITPSEQAPPARLLQLPHCNSICALFKAAIPFEVISSAWETRRHKQSERQAPPLLSL